MLSDHANSRTIYKHYRAFIRHCIKKMKNTATRACSYRKQKVTVYNTGILQMQMFSVVRPKCYMIVENPTIT